MTFTVTPENDVPPIADLTNVNLNRASAGSTVFELTDLPENVDAGETLTVTVVSATAQGGTATVDADTQAVQYTPPNPDFVGTDTITYTVSDGVETSTGTITVEVTDFETRKITLAIGDAAGMPQIDGIVLRGTNLLGEAVEVPLDMDGGNADFGDLMPGDYNIEIPANPFLQGADEPQQIPVTSLPEDGDVTVPSNVGPLKAKFVSLRDMFGSASRKSLLVAIEPGQTSVLTIVSPEVDVDVTDVSLDANTGAVTVQAIRTETDDSGVETQQNVEAVASTDDESRVETRGVAGDYRLLKIKLDDNGGLNFNPVTETSGEETTGDETTGGSEDDELPAGDGEGEAASSSAPSSLMIGTMQAEGESAPALAVTQADLFVPVASDQSTRSDAVVLSTERGDLWFGEANEFADMDRNRGIQTAEDTHENSQVVDEVMQNVTEELTIIKSAGDDLIDTDSSVHSLNESSIDAALGSEI